MKHSYGRPPTRRLVFWAGLGFVLAVLLAPLPGYWRHATAADTAANPQAEFWRQVRQGDSGYTAVSGPETAVLIHNGGQNWRALRNGPVTVWGAWILAGMLLLTGGYYLVKGRVRIEHGRSGLTVPRWDLFDRVIHGWITVLFLILAVTGLSLLFGRTAGLFRIRAKSSNFGVALLIAARRLPLGDGSAPDHAENSSLFKAFAHGLPVARCSRQCQVHWRFS